MQKDEEKILDLKGKSLEEGEWSDIVVIRPHGEYVSYKCDPSLENMQALVGGYIEVVPMFSKIGSMSCLVLCDEEGKLKGKPVNNRATLEWAKCCPQLQQNGQFLDMLVGDIVVLTGKAKKKFER